ncbi:MAG: quercetin dioxygenase-like cupin family protein [Gammaproteobacteria bacterium]|jgi:quercetin dioxygenase-like cupin family protein
MSANDGARSVNVTEAANFSPHSRTNQEIMATGDLVTRMNCYEPGQSTPQHMHPDEDETLYVVEGSGSVTVEGDEALAINTGDLIYLPAGRFHQIDAGPHERMVLIYFMKPDYTSVRPDKPTVDQGIDRLHGEQA